MDRRMTEQPAALGRSLMVALAVAFAAPAALAQSAVPEAPAGRPAAAGEAPATDTVVPPAADAQRIAELARLALGGDVDAMDRIQEFLAESADPTEIARRAQALIEAARGQGGQVDPVAVAQVAGSVAQRAGNVLRSLGLLPDVELAAQADIDAAAAEALAEMSTAAGPDRVAELVDLDGPTAEPTDQISPE